MIVVWAIGLVVGLVVASLASRRAVLAALTASEVSRISLGAIGMTVMAVGTDLPEIAASITAAIGGHGDLVIGDAAGSALTQVTLVLAILLIAMPPVEAERLPVAVLGALTVLALVVVSVLVGDGVFSRADGLLLVLGWVVGIALVDQARPRPPEPVPRHAARALPFVGRALGWLAVVGGASALVVHSFVEVTDAIGVPELVASAIVLSLGTSLPELVVDWTAIRRGAAALALGDLFGSSLVDASLAIGIGPALRSVSVSADAAATCLVAAGGIALATTLVASQSPHGRASGVGLLAIYALAAAGLIAVAV